jgi:hypothetical protein
MTATANGAERLLKVRWTFGSEETAGALALIFGLFLKNEEVSNAQASLAFFLILLSPGLPRPTAQRPENDRYCK